MKIIILKHFSNLKSYDIILFTLIPSLASLSATPFPIPRLAPVTNARVYFGADMIKAISHMNWCKMYKFNMEPQKTCFYCVHA